MTPTVQNLNAKLSPRPRESPRVAAANRHLARPASPTQARTIARRKTWRGGYLIDV